jgi:signal peptidase I
MIRGGGWGGSLQPPGSALWSSPADSESGDNSSSNPAAAADDEQPGKSQWSKLSKETKDDIVATSGAFLFALLVRILLVEPRFIPSLSMFPTFDIGDQLLVDKVSHIARPYQRRDVVVFNPPLTYVELTGNTEALIKRVVAVEGDTVEVKNRHLFINGEQQQESFINEDPDYTLEPLKVPAGMLLVLGDNRNHSYDSHIWGFLPRENVIGRAVFKYWPLWRLGGVEGSE